MVQPKNPTPVVRPPSIDELHPVIDTRWYVIEITPGYDTGGYYSQDVPERRVRVSGYFSNAIEANDWMDEHIPDEGKRLQVVKQNKRRTVTERWW